MFSKEWTDWKDRLSSEMSEYQIKAEIRSVFKVAMEDNPCFEFEILQIAGGSSKSLIVPATSASFQWSASAVAGRNAKTPIYVLALNNIKVQYIHCMALIVFKTDLYKHLG